MSAKFDIKKASDGQFMFNLKAANGEVILTSEMYKKKSSAKNGIKSVKKNAPDEGRFNKLTSSNEKPYFTLKAANHQVIGTSQMYQDESGRDNGIESVQTNAPDAAIDDQTL